MKLNVTQWHKDRLEIESTIRELKSRKYESFQPNWRHGPDDWKLATMKENATALYWIRTYLRGKIEKKPGMDEKLVKMMSSRDLILQEESVAV